MAKTGYLVSVYMDANPYSPTYGQERTERELDTTECQTQQPANYVHVYTYCEMAPNGAYTGNCVKVYEDVEPLSPTYGQQMEEVYTDGTLCPPDSEEADWQQIGQYCEQIAYQPSGKLGNSGYMVTVYRDMGEYSPTYNQTREDKTQDLVHCTPPSTEDVWVVISETCHLVDGLKDGTKDVVRVNTNEYSPNYNDGQSETVNVEDLTMCPLDPESPIWTETSYVCVLDEGYRTGYITVTEEDTNPQSASYGQTRTRTYEDLERCPYQPKPQPVTLKWRVVNNRSASTDTITSITLHFNGNFDIDILGNIAPVGGMLQGTANLPASLTSTGLVLASVELSPNTSLPRLFQTQQTPSPFVWSDSTGSDVLVVTLWDGDGTGPEWTEVSYTCETAGGYRTGASIVVEEDVNPESGTYGQTRTRTVENDSRCPAQTDGDWVETSWSCQQESGYNTGNVLSVQTDQNPNSSTYNTTRTRIIYDTTRCPLDTTAAWTEVSYVCEQVDGKYNTGTIIITETDINPGSATYNTTRTRTATGDSRCVRNENPDWVEESYVCEQEPEHDTTPNWVEQSRTCVTSNGYNTGYAEVVELDTNPYSATYNTTRTTTVQDLVNCPIDTTPNWSTVSTSCEQYGTNPNWVETSRTCVKSDGYNTGYATVVETDVNQYSSTYEQTRTSTVEDLTTCPIDSPNWVEQSRTCEKDGNNQNTGNAIVVELDANPNSATYNTTRTRTVEDLTNCPLVEYKLTYTTTDGSGSMICDGYNFTYADVSPIRSSIVTANFGSCLRTIEYFSQCSNLTTVYIEDGVYAIADSAFSNCSSLSSVNIPDSIHSIGKYAFMNDTSLQSVTIGNGVTLIKDAVFQGCTGLTSVTIGSGVTRIYQMAFGSCTSLTSVTILATTPPTLDDINAFYNNGSGRIFYVPANKVSTYKGTRGWSSFKNNIQAIPNS